MTRPGRTLFPFITLSFLAVATLSPAAAKDATPPVEIVTEAPTDMNPDVVTDVPPVEGDITAGKALRAIYGNYDEATGSATWLADVAAIARVEQQTEYRVRKAGRSRESYRVVAIGEQRAGSRYLLLTKIDLQDEGPPIGGAIFTWSEEGWRLSWARRIIKYGSRGRTEPVRIGPDRYGFLRQGQGSRQGYTEGWTEIIGEMDNALKPLLMLSETSSAYKERCERKTPPHYCWQYSSTFAFEPNPYNAEYFDLHRMTSGTYAEYRGAPIRRVHADAVYTLRHRRYWIQ